MKAVVFDLDGTLVDSEPDLRAAANKLLRENGLPDLDRATVARFIGHGIAKLVERCFAHHDVVHANITVQVGRFKELYRAENHRGTSLNPGVEAALLNLAERGTALALCTNKDSDFALAILRRFGIESLFRIVVGGDSGLAPKPDPAPLLNCLAACDVSTEDAAYVGDSEIDAKTAAAAGVPFVLFTEGYGTAPSSALAREAAFSDYTTLPALIAAASKARERARNARKRRAN